MGSGRNAEVLVSQPAAKRRYRSKQERRRIVEETLEPGASVAVIARQHGVNANQVFYWRKLYREGRLELLAALPAKRTAMTSAPPG
jgi:transposase